MTNQGAPETTEQAPVPVQGEKEVINLKVHKILKFFLQEKMVENQTESDDEDFAADTQELEEAAESSGKCSSFKLFIKKILRVGE